jgi:GEVED domain/Ig-like domain CHU_C associated
MNKNYTLENTKNQAFTTLNACFSKPKNSSFFGLIIVVLAFFVFDKSNGQVANYTFSESAGAYTSIGVGTELFPAASWDDNISANTPIGFTFNFNGGQYTTCSVSGNGHLTLGGTTTFININTILSSDTVEGVISAVGTDLIHGSGNVAYTTTGAPGSRTFTVEWKNAKRYSFGAVAGDDLNFQIQLKEGTNVINFVYGTMTVSNAANTVCQVGLRGFNNTDFYHRSLVSNVVWDGNTATAGANNSSVRLRNAVKPSSGRTFIWTPVTTACAAPTTSPSALVLTPVSGGTITGSFTNAAPIPNRYLVIANTTNVPPVLTNGTYYTIGSTFAGGNIVVDIDRNTTFSTTGLGLLASTQYYFFVYSYNALCTGGPIYKTTVPATGTATTTVPTVCTPSSTTATNYISGVSATGTIIDGSNTPTTYSAGGYGDFTATTLATQIASGAVNINITFAGVTSHFIRCYIDWNKNGDFNDPNELVYTTGNTATGATSFGFIIPPGQAIGNYRMRIRTRIFGDSSTIDSCTPAYASGEAEDYTIAVIADCPQKVTAVSGVAACGPSNPVALTAVSAGATSFKWYSSEFGSTLLATTPSGSWTTPTINVSTIYYVTALNGSCESLSRTPVLAVIKPTTNITLTPSVPDVCGDNAVITLTAGGDTIEETIYTEDFEAANSLTITTPTNTNGGVDTPFSVKTSPYQPVGTTVWKPAINSNAPLNGNKFLFSTSDYTSSVIQTIATSSNINATAYDVSAKLTFDQYYSYFAGDSGEIQVSTNGGGTWSAVLATYNTDLGSSTAFSTATVDLSAYKGMNFIVRFVYNATWDDGWAIDNIVVTGVRTITGTTFTWSGGATAYINPTCISPTDDYTGQAVNTIYVKPSLAQLSGSSWMLTASATLGNGCPATKSITINNKTRTWAGTTNDWNTASNWLPAVVPDITNCVVVPTSGIQPSLSTGLSGNGKNLLVKNGGILEVQSGNSLTIKETVTVNAGGNFIVRNNSSLIQIDNVANTVAGTFIYERTAPSIKGSDYVYWSSPVLNQDISTIYTTPVSGPKYQWNTTAANANAGLGTWGTASGVMTPSKGYIMRGSSNYGMAATNLNAVFTGAPNNGDLNIKATRGDMVPANVGPSLTYPNPVLSAWNDNWTLVGNPYPSALNALQFLSTNSVELMGNVRLWRHLSDPLAITSPFYQNYTYNYNSNDYLSINFTGPTVPGASEIIKSGQAFLVQRKEGPQDLVGVDVTFNNLMRLTPTSTVMNNSGFFKSSNSKEATSSEKHRIWLDIVDDATHASETTLLGYVDGATSNFDDNYDASIGISSAIGIYSFTDNQKCIIQGKSLPFNEEDTVPIGINVQTNGSYNIAIRAVDGLFDGATQNIYLEDKLLNSIHNLKTAPYSFTSAAGKFNDRFVLRYTNNAAALSNTDFDFQNSVSVFTNNSLTVKSNNQTIKEVIVYDVLGKTLTNQKNINKNEISLSELKPTNNVLIVKVILENGAEKTQKVIF